MTNENIWTKIAERALRTGAHIPLVEEEFDHERALCGLHWNFQFNRKSKQAVVTNFAASIKDGSFAVGTPLRIARNENGHWVLVDGQHRLMAIVEAGIKIWMTIVIDERPAHIAYSSIDNIGTIRTTGDALSSALGWSTKYWMAVHAAATIISENFSLTQVSYHGNKNSKSEKLNFLVETSEKYKDAIMMLINKKSEKKYYRAPMLAVHIVAAHYAPDKFWKYYCAALENDKLGKNSPEKKLNDTLNISCKLPDERFKILCYTTACWNAAFKHEELFKFPQVYFGVQNKTQVPKILGTPYPL